MVRLDEFLFGYSRGKVEKCEISRLVNTLLRLGMCASITPEGDFTVRQKDKARFLAAARGRIHLELSEPLGLHGFALKIRRCYGFFSAIILLFGIFLLSGSMVWDMRVSGNEVLNEYAVEDALGEMGFGVGARWQKVDKNGIEASLLCAYPEIAWVSINRRGTVAYIELIESENVGVKENASPIYSNIVADRDCVIEEITVKSGEAVVKVGDVVKAGDVLISGVIDNEAGVRLSRAEGCVRGSSVTEIVAEAPREISERVTLTQRITRVRVIIFNFSINIFKNYGNPENTCDIIEEIRRFALFDRYKLPFFIEKTYRREYTEHVRSRTDDEMIISAKRELDSKMYSAFKNADVIRLRTDADFLDNSYRLTTRVVYVTDVGRESAIEIN